MVDEKSRKVKSVRGFMNCHLLSMGMESKHCIFQALYTQSSTTSTRESTRPEENTEENEEEDIPLEEACVVCQVSYENFLGTITLVSLVHFL